MTRTTARLTGIAGAFVAGTLLGGCADDGSDAAHSGPMMSNGDTPDSTSDGAERSANETTSRSPATWSRTTGRPRHMDDGQNADAIALAESIRDSQTAEMEPLLTELRG